MRAGGVWLALAVGCGPAAPIAVIDVETVFVGRAAISVGDEVWMGGGRELLRTFYDEPTRPELRPFECATTQAVITPNHFIDLGGQIMFVGGYGTRAAFVERGQRP